jgi:hypothetical protein
MCGCEGRTKARLRGSIKAKALRLCLRHGKPPVCCHLRDDPIAAAKTRTLSAGPKFRAENNGFKMWFKPETVYFRSNKSPLPDNLRLEAATVHFSW